MIAGRLLAVADVEVEVDDSTGRNTAAGRALFAVVAAGIEKSEENK